MPSAINAILRLRQWLNGGSGNDCLTSRQNAASVPDFSGQLLSTGSQKYRSA
ncbi:hypothetical protein KCP70_02560 [Salmonella enterica subsp. enterica]|nr:hypothetical protein KCP70_02560 [Salmonella enterica subsp. enterica]